MAKKKVKRLSKARSNDLSLQYVKLDLANRNKINKLYNKHLGKLKSSYRDSIIANEISKAGVSKYKKEKAKAQKYVDRETDKITKSSGIFKVQKELDKYRLDNTALLEESINNPDFGVLKQAQPGTRVVGGSHPCCVWYEREEDVSVSSHSGPTLSPNNPALTGWAGNWLANNRLEMKFSITGNADDQYTDAYIGYGFFSANTAPMPRRGKVRFRIQVQHVYNYLLVHGSNDWFSSDDYGWAGLYHRVTIDRLRGSNYARIFNTWNSGGNLYSGTEWREHQFAEATSNVSPHSVTNLNLSVNTNNLNNTIIVEAGDRFFFSIGVLFYGCAYGDEGAYGGASAYYSNHGSYIEVPPIRMLLEECEE